MAVLDPAKNFAKTTLAAGITSTDTAVTVQTGEAAKFPDPAVDGAFNVVIWDKNTYQDPSDDPNAEIVRVTAVSGDTFTITRAQEGTTAAAHGAGSGFILGLTASVIQNIDSYLHSHANKTYLDSINQALSTSSIVLFNKLGLGGVTDPKQALHIIGNLILQDGGSDIGVPTGQILQIGEWDSTWTTFTSRMEVAVNNLELKTLGLLLPNNKYIKWRDSTGTIRNIILFDNNDDFKIRHPLNKSIIFMTSSTERVRIDGAGNFGINSTAPTHKLEVGGDAAFRRPVKPKTANYVVTVAESNTLFTNEGATAEVIFTLPTPQAGLMYTFYIQTAQTLTIQADATATIRVGNAVSAAGGTASGASVGNLLKLTAVNTTEWIAEIFVGEWTLT